MNGSISLSAVSRRNNDWKGGKTTRETEEIMGIECGKKGMERKKKKGGTKDVIAVSIEKIQDIFARPISMIFFFFFFFFEDWKIFRNGRALVASGIKSYDPFIEAFVIPWYIRRNSSSPGSLCEKWMSNLQLGLLFENIILDKNEKSIYKEREREMYWNILCIPKFIWTCRVNVKNIRYSLDLVLGFVRGRFELSLKMKYFMEMENWCVEIFFVRIIKFIWIRRVNMRGISGLF